MSIFKVLSIFVNKNALVLHFVNGDLIRNVILLILGEMV